MFRLATTSLIGRRVLTIETDFELAADMARDIENSGGTLVGAVPGIPAALAFLSTGLGVDCAMMAAPLLDTADVASLDILRAQGVEIVFVTGFDEWYEEEWQEEVTYYAVSA